MDCKKSDKITAYAEKKTLRELNKYANDGTRRQRL